MSYEITFKNIPEDKIIKYDVKPYDDFKVTKSFIRYSIIESCMKYKDKFDGDLKKFYDAILGNLRYLALIEQNFTKKSLYDDYNSEDEYSLKGELTICGSIYRSSNLDCEDIDTIIDYCVEELMKYGVLIDTCDYWENAERWNDKYVSIYETIDNFISDVRQSVIMSFKQEFYEYSDEYTDNQIHALVEEVNKSGIIID